MAITLSLKRILVLNLIITGMPSIPYIQQWLKENENSFKPYYNWNAFNTNGYTVIRIDRNSFKPYYNWNAFNTKN